MDIWQPHTAAYTRDVGASKCDPLYGTAIRQLFALALRIAAYAFDMFGGHQDDFSIVAGVRSVRGRRYEL